MKRYLLGFIMLVVLFLPQASWGITTYANPYRETMWNKLTDSVHTIGQSHAQAQATKTRLRKVRATARFHSIYVANKGNHKAWTIKKNN